MRLTCDHPLCAHLKIPGVGAIVCQNEDNVDDDTDSRRDTAYSDSVKCDRVVDRKE